MTCPKANVCRVKRIGPLPFPDDEKNFVSRMKTLIRTIWKIKTLWSQVWTLFQARMKIATRLLTNPPTSARSHHPTIINRCHLQNDEGSAKRSPALPAIHKYLHCHSLTVFYPTPLNFHVATSSFHSFLIPVFCTYTLFSILHSPFLTVTK